MAYASLIELKAAVGISDAADDDPLTLALDAASELVDQHTNRTFVADATATTRYYTASSYNRVETDDIYTTTSLVVSSYNVTVPAAVAYTSAGYELGPINAAALGRPYTYITHTAGWSGAIAFPGALSTLPGAIAVTAKWGFAATVPDAVKQATLLQASRIFARRHSPYGISGSPDIGGELRLLARVDPDVAVLLRPFVRMWGAR